MLKDKIKRIEPRGGNPILLDPWVCGIEVNERADLEAKLAIKEGRDSQLLLQVAYLKTEWRK
jgi:hypothetical protein